ncbi:MAG TPA: hypothetical protein VK557_02520 [Pyrinomonadaceae bacterium]|nr:hypothetical protein [Pyrinomonadaceae bacterium]
MKKQAYTMMALLVLMGSMAMAAKAQTSGRRQLIANIPFQFNVGEASLPAGEYAVTQINPASDRAVLQIRARDGSRTAMVSMNSAIRNSPDGAALVFNRYGNKYFLAQAWVDGATDGLRAVKSRSEHATQKEMAALNVRIETVALKSR